MSGSHILNARGQWIYGRTVLEHHLAPVVQKVDKAIHRINLYPLDSAIGFLTLICWIVIYLLESAIHLLNNRGLVVPGA